MCEELHSINAITELITELLDHLQKQSKLSVHVACTKFRSVIDKYNPPKQEPTPPAPLKLDTSKMSAEEANEFARRRIGFGKYAEVCYGLCPREYLDWLVETKKTDWLTLLRYLKSR